jgi:hypothetical protein
MKMKELKEQLDDLFGMLGFLDDVGTLDIRKVAYDEFSWGFVSTVAVSDGDQPYETAIAHSDYRDDRKLIVVESYSTKEGALFGHKKWVTVMTSNNPPNELTDCCNARIAQKLRSMSEPGSMTYKRK